MELDEAAQARDAFERLLGGAFRPAPLAAYRWIMIFPYLALSTGQRLSGAKAGQQGLGILSSALPDGG